MGNDVWPAELRRFRLLRIRSSAAGASTAICHAVLRQTDITLTPQGDVIYM